MKSSIVKKQIMGISGLLLCSFLVVHLAGNCLLYLGPSAFNSYAHALISSPLLYPAEFFLLSVFLLHIVLALVLTLENREARGAQNYYVKRHTGRGAGFASSTMPWTGGITLVFLVFHLWHIKYGPHYEVVYEGVKMRDLYRLLVEYFASPMTVLGYIFAQVALGVHLSHGLWSAFQSLGFNHPVYTPRLKVFSKVYAVLIAVGFSALPVYLSQKGGG